MGRLGDTDRFYRLWHDPLPVLLRTTEWHLPPTLDLPPGPQGPLEWECCFSTTLHMSRKCDSEESEGLLNSRRMIFFIFLFITQPSGLPRQKDCSTSGTSVMDESVLTVPFSLLLTFSIVSSLTVSGIDWCVQCVLQGLVHSFPLQIIMLFSRCKEDSLFVVFRCRTVMELSPHSNDIRVRLVDMNVPWKTPTDTILLSERCLPDWNCHERCKELGFSFIQSSSWLRDCGLSYLRVDANRTCDSYLSCSSTSSLFSRESN